MEFSEIKVILRGCYRVRVNLTRGVKKIKQMGRKAIINSKKYRKLYKKQTSS